ncbi:MAG: YggT family protein [Longimicrobiales bacterium]
MQGDQESRDEPLHTGEGSTERVARRAGVERRVEQQPVTGERRVTVRRAEDVQRRDAEQRRHILARVTQGVDYLFYLLYGLLGIRFVLTLLGASEQAGFVRFIHGLTDPFYTPFSGIITRPTVDGGLLDFPLLIALLAYALLHIAIRGLLRLLAGTRRL